MPCEPHALSTLAAPAARTVALAILTRLLMGAATRDRLMRGPIYRATARLRPRRQGGGLRRAPGHALRRGLAGSGQGAQKPCAVPAARSARNTTTPAARVITP